MTNVNMSNGSSVRLRTGAAGVAENEDGASAERPANLLWAIDEIIIAL
jgi:hypothetical protein